mgnify:FL=1
MPKLTYTPKKGLVQSPGTGVDLTAVNSDVCSRRRVISLTNAATTARVLLASESGALVSLDNNTNTATTITVTMPAVASSKGVWFDFILPKDAQHNDADIILKTEGNSVDFIGSIVGGEASNANLLTVAHSKIENIPDGTDGKKLGGTTLGCVCDGSNWYLTHFTTPADYDAGSNAGLKVSANV